MTAAKLKWPEIPRFGTAATTALLPSRDGKEVATEIDCLIQIGSAAAMGTFDPDWLDSVLERMAAALYAARTGKSDYALIEAMRLILARYDDAAAKYRANMTGSAEPAPGQHTIEMIMGRRATATAAVTGGFKRPGSFDDPVVGASMRGMYDLMAAEHEKRMLGLVNEEMKRRLAQREKDFEEAASPSPASSSTRAVPLEQGAIAVADANVREGQESDRASQTPRMALEGRRLRKSLLPTWFALVGLSWVALLWGGIISLPLGIGAAAMGGIIAVPLWGTVFGFLGMGRAAESTLKAMGYQPLGPEVFLVQSCGRFAQSLGIKAPRVGTIDAFNAFAMGSNENDGTIAMGRPLLEALTPDEAEAVLAHEIAHVVSGDMKRMMLMRTFQNATVWFMMAQGLKQFVRWVICWAAELYILAFSRKREYWADAIGAALTSKEAMIGALRKLEAGPPLTDEENTHARFMVRGRISGLFSTHPSGEERIAALEQETYVRQLPRVTL